MLYNFIFPQYCREKLISLLIRAVRIFFGVLFFVHGLDKMINFSALSETFPSVLGFGSYMSLMLSVFCEFCCSLFLIAGLLERIILLPMIISMGVAFFYIHDAMMPEGELSLIYLVIFIILLVTGPGRYSLDYMIDMKFQKEKKVKL
ncbi:MAG: DoxX family protein [Bacteroidaceae bacterium]|nr:DoxX family protein [Bacteroidaceae bacterium]